MKKISIFLAMCLLAGALAGCASRSKEYAGYYSSDDPEWFINLTEDGSFTYAFWEADPNKPVPVGTGYCDFSGLTPDHPKVMTHLDMMKDRFSLYFSPDKSQLVVMLNGDTIVSRNYGKQVKLHRRVKPIE